MTPTADTIADEVARRSSSDGGRFIVAVAGAPGAGKSTFADALAGAIDRRLGREFAAVVPMDGFHYDNAVLKARGHMPRKGAPFTFDVEGYASLLARLRDGRDEVAVPVFDRGLDLSRAGGRIVTRGHRVIVAEGNYLLLDSPPWNGLSRFFDLTVFLDVPEPVLRDRLVARWLHFGLDRQAAEARATVNDLENARLVIAASRPADIVVS